MNIGGATRFLAIFYELSKTIVIALVALFLVHIFIATIFMVDGASMDPNLATGEIVVVNKIAYLTSSPIRGDIVVLRFPGDPINSRYIKRIIGLPNEKVDVKDGKVYVNDQELLEIYLPKDEVTFADNYKSTKLGRDEYYLIGDNRKVSSDSRIWGPAKKEDLIGRTRFILYPLNLSGYISNVYY